MSSLRIACVFTLLSCALECSGAPFLFGATSASGDQRLYINGNSEFFDTSESRFRLVDNQGWWSLDTNNLANSANYIVGTDELGRTYRNFFTFDLSDWDGTATSAYLSVPRGNSNFTTPVVYTLWDVSTPAASLNQTIGQQPGIYDDLGTGLVLGRVVVSDLATPDPLVVELNAAGLATLNAAAGGFFSVGGTLEPVPEPGTFLLSAAVLAMVYGIKGLRKSA